MLGLVLPEPLINALSGDLSNVRHSGKRFQRGVHQGIHGAEGSSQTLAGFHPYLADTQCIDQSGYILLLAGLNGGKQFFCRGGARLPEAGNLLQSQIVDICRGFDELLRDQTFYNG